MMACQAEPDNVREIFQRIQSQWSVVEEIREKCGVGSISVGVLHEGDVIFTGSTGYRDVAAEEPADSSTLYALCSVSKTFLAAALGILVDRGKCAWDDPVGPYLPEFKAKDDLRVSQEATFTDFLRHSGGLANPVVTILGPGGKVLVPETDFISVLNDTPTGDKDFGPYYDATWVYSNVAYGLLALVVERLSGKRYADFVSDEILKPLGMKDTVMHKSQLEGHTKVAGSWVRLSDGSWFKQPEHEWTNELNTPVLAFVGIRSSVRDMLIWCAATMDSVWPSQPSAVLSDMTNPLKQMDSILDGCYWSRPSRDENPCNFHLPWLKCVIPSSMLHSGSWNMTLPSISHILGRDAPHRTLYKCTGTGYCGASSVNLFPKTKSSVVVLSSGLNAGDPSDFTAALLIQGLFDLRPRIDIMPMVKHEVATQLQSWDTIVSDWAGHRDLSTPEHPVTDYVGRYRGLGITLDVRKRESSELEVIFGGREEIAQALERCNEDMYSYLPTNRDEWLRDAWLDWDYYLVGVLHSQRDKTGQVTSVTWCWEEGCDPTWFDRDSW